MKKFSRKRRIVLRIVFGSLVCLLLLVGFEYFYTQYVSHTHVPLQISASGTIDNANYEILIPHHWNKTLVLFSRGMSGNPDGVLSNSAIDTDVDSEVRDWFLMHNYALAASTYSQPYGWVVKQGLHDQMVLLDFFAQQYGQPRYTISWGNSMGGLVAIGLAERFPTRFSGVLSNCGIVGGALPMYNQGMDVAFVFKTLLASNTPLQVAHIANPVANHDLAKNIFEQAKQTKQGRARLAFAFAMIDLPGFARFTSIPSSDIDVNTANMQITNQMDVMDRRDMWDNAFGSLRAQIEHAAGGNPTWNTGIDYSLQLANSIDRSEVEVLYREAGLSLEQDLKVLSQSPRIAADSRAKLYLDQNMTPQGNVSIPTLTMHNVDDGMVPVENEQAYSQHVQRTGSQNMLLQLYMNHSGHCDASTGAELITCFQILMQRIETGQWTKISPEILNKRAQAMGHDFTVDAYQSQSAPAFVAYNPALLLR